MITIRTHRETKYQDQEYHDCIFCLDRRARYWSQADIEGKPISVSLWHCQSHRYAARATLMRDQGYKTLETVYSCFCQGVGMCTCSPISKMTILVWYKSKDYPYFRSF